MMNKKYGTPYYIAPEVLKNEYNEKCDVWSCGVILYILISGQPPFPGNNEIEIIKRVENGIYHMDTTEWKNVSYYAKDLIRHMLDIDPSKRYSSMCALNHKWITKYTDEESEENTVLILDNLKKFRTSSKFEKLAYMYIMTQLMTPKEKKKLQKTFEGMDKNHDGTLSKDELIEGYTKIYGDRIKAIRTVEEILEEADNDGNGNLDYTEFLIATANRTNYLSEEKLKTIFEMFDQDKCGYITLDEIKSLLGDKGAVSDKAWDAIIKEVDQNGDGKISYEEFKTMMLKVGEVYTK